MRWTRNFEFLYYFRLLHGTDLLKTKVVYISDFFFLSNIHLVFLFLKKGFNFTAQVMLNKKLWLFIPCQDASSAFIRMLYCASMKWSWGWGALGKAYLQIKQHTCLTFWQHALCIKHLKAEDNDWVAFQILIKESTHLHTAKGWNCTPISYTDSVHSNGKQDLQRD